MDEFTQGYLDCALWLTDEHPGSGAWTPHDAYTIENIDPESLARMRDQCDAFQREQYWPLREAYDFHAYERSRAGHDFYLTRNHHGAGYWDRELGTIGEALTEAAHAYGAQELYMGDGGQLYAS